MLLGSESYGTKEVGRPTSSRSSTKIKEVGRPTRGVCSHPSMRMILHVSCEEEIFFPPYSRVDFMSKNSGVISSKA